MTKVLFLDVDGVLNHRACYTPSRGGGPLDPDAIRRLHAVVERTGCRVVLSSTWRTLPGMADRLRERGAFPHEHEDWRTVELPYTTVNGIIQPTQRGSEIAEWLSRHPEVERYAIIDDDADMLPEQQPFFVQTTFETGLLDEHALRLVDLLGGQLSPFERMAIQPADAVPGEPVPFDLSVRLPVAIQPHKGFTGTVQYDADDKVFHGRVAGTGKDIVTFEASDAEGVQAAFVASVDDFLAFKSGDRK